MKKAFLITFTLLASLFIFHSKAYAANINLSLKSDGTVENSDTGETVGELHRGWRNNVLFIPIVNDAGRYIESITLTSADGLLNMVDPKLYSAYGTTDHLSVSNASTKQWDVDPYFTGQINIVAQVSNGVFQDPFFWKIITLLTAVPDVGWMAFGIALPLMLLIWLWQRNLHHQRVAEEDNQIYPEILNTSPAALTVLLRGFVSRRASAATLVDLAVRGHLRILIRDDNIVMYRDKGKDELKNHESFMLERWFKQKQNSSGLELSREIKNELVNQQSKIANVAIYQEVDSYGWFKPSPLITHWKLYTITFLLTLTFGAIFLAVYIFLPSATPLLWVLASIMLTIAILYASAPTIAHLSPHGKETLSRLAANKKILTAPEPMPANFTDSDAWEKFLPLAIVLGVAPKWLNRWRKADFRQPSWLLTPEPVRDFDQLLITLTPMLNLAASSIRDTILPAYT